MQQRTHVSFTKWWKELDTVIISYSPLRPQLRVAPGSNRLEFVPDSITMEPPVTAEHLQRWMQQHRDMAQEGAKNAADAAHASDGTSSKLSSITEQQGVWDVSRFISLLLGEIPRLRDDTMGYGPNGKGFIDHVDIPAEVEDAHAWLAGRYPDLLRA